MVLARVFHSRPLRGCRQAIAFRSKVPPKPLSGRPCPQRKYLSMLVVREEGRSCQLGCEQVEEERRWKARIPGDLEALKAKPQLSARGPLV